MYYMYNCYYTNIYKKDITINTNVLRNFNRSSQPPRAEWLELYTVTILTAENNPILYDNDNKDIQHQLRGIFNKIFHKIELTDDRMDNFKSLNSIVLLPAYSL